METFWLTLESTASVFVAFVVGLVVFLLAGAFVVATPKEMSRWVIALGVAVIIAEVGFLYWLKVGLERGEKPFIPLFVLRQRRWPLAIRPLMAAWWAAHLGATLPAIWLAEQIIGLGPITPPRMIAAVFVVWMLIHCTLLYLLLATTALVRRARIVRFAWRYRFAIDLVLTTAVMLLARKQGWTLK